MDKRGSDRECVECGFSRARELRTGKSRRIFLTVSPTFTVDRPESFYEPWRESNVTMCKPWAFSTAARAFEALLFFRRWT